MTSEIKEKWRERVGSWKTSGQELQAAEPDELRQMLPTDQISGIREGILDITVFLTREVPGG